MYVFVNETNSTMECTRTLGELANAMKMASDFGYTVSVWDELGNELSEEYLYGYFDCYRHYVR